MLKKEKKVFSINRAVSRMGTMRSHFVGAREQSFTMARAINLSFDLLGERKLRVPSLLQEHLS